MSTDEQATNADLVPEDRTDEWATPPDLVRKLARAVGGFGLDAAAGAETSPIADAAFTEADDGTVQAWFGGVVWCNPPYGAMEDWTPKVINEMNRDEVDTILFLVKGDTSADWWHMALSAANAVCLIDYRLTFGDSDDAAPFASHIFVFGELTDAVRETLHAEGALLDTEDKHTTAEQTTLVAGD